MYVEGLEGVVVLCMCVCGGVGGGGVQLTIQLGLKYYLLPTNNH